MLLVHATPLFVPWPGAFRINDFLAPEHALASPATEDEARAYAHERELRNCA